MLISIVIVNYNTPQLLLQTIQSVINSTKDINYEIIVVDNASSDNSVELLRKNYSEVKLLVNDRNLGFSKANNIGIRASKGEYILLLNSDTIVQQNCIKKCLNFAESNNKIGVVGCKVVLKNGKLDKACKRSFPTPLNSFFYAIKLDKIFPKNKLIGAYNLTYLNEDDTYEVECVMGAFMLIKRDVIEEVGLLDEDFFMYGEDVDWCYRIKEAGWKIFYYPQGKIIHYKKASSNKKRWKTIYEFHRAMYLFYNKHYRSKYNPIISLFMYIGIAVKLILALSLNLFKRR